MSHTPEPTRPPRRRPPPDYNSRRVQFRLFVLVAGAMLVLYLVTEAAKPEKWTWLTGTKPPQVEEELPEDVDTTLPELPGGPSAPGVVTISDPFRGSLDEEAELDGLDPVARALADGWSGFYEQSNRDEHDLIAQALRHAELKRVLEPETATQFSELLAKIDRFWNGYRDDALQALDTAAEPLPADERKMWEGVLERVVAAWHTDRAALAKVTQMGEIAYSAAEQETLRRWRLRWERLALAAIQDDTVHWHKEANAWFRLLDILNTTDREALQKQPAERVGFVQLFKEPNEYRGKLVRIKGRIKQGRLASAGRNVYGIKEHYILWVEPEGGPKSPIAVYSLEMPRGFPSLTTPNLSNGYTTFREGEDVEITGYFFKRWAYPSRPTTRVAPLILAKCPEWRPDPEIARGAGDIPSRGVLLSWVFGSAVFGVLVASIAYWRSVARSPAMDSLAASPSAQRELERSLAGAEAGPSVLEALRQLEERDQGRTP